MPELTYLQAISDGLREEMRHDESVLLHGRGHRRLRRRLQGHRGLHRGVRRRPRLGHAAGRVGHHRDGGRRGGRGAAPGLRDAVRRLHRLRLRPARERGRRRCTTARGSPCRWPCACRRGGGFSGGPFHSQNPEAWFLQRPGLKVVAPATPEDAKGLLAAAIRDPNPVLFMEHKHLYRRARGEVPEGRYETPLGEARVAREGTDLTVIAYGAMVPAGARGDRGPRRGARRGDRPALARAARPWRRCSRRVRKTSKVVVAARGHAAVRRGRGGGRADRRGGVRGPRRPGRARDRAGQPGAVLARRSSARSCPRSRTSRRPAVGSSPTDGHAGDVTMPADGRLGRRGDDRAVAEARGRAGGGRRDDRSTSPPTRSTPRCPRPRLGGCWSEGAWGRAREARRAGGEVAGSARSRWPRQSTTEAPAGGRQRRPRHRTRPRNADRPAPASARRCGAPISPVWRRPRRRARGRPARLDGQRRGGRVTKRDVLEHVDGDLGEAPRRSPAGEPLSPMRRQIAEHMVRSLRTAAHCTTIVEVDMSGVEAARGRRPTCPGWPTRPSPPCASTARSTRRSRTTA